MGKSETAWTEALEGVGDLAGWVVDSASERRLTHDEIVAELHWILEGQSDPED